VVKGLRLSSSGFFVYCDIMALSLKTSFRDDIRRVSVSADLTFSALVERLKKMYSDLTEEFVVRYRDEDGDVVSVR
jgi:hypothetical protein